MSYTALYEAVYGALMVDPGYDPYQGLTDSAADILARLPEGWVDTDTTLPTLVAALAVGLDELDAVAADAADGAPGWVKLVDPTRAVTVQQARWAGQLVGVRVPHILTLAEAVDLVVERNRWRRGTPAAIKAATRPYLKPGTGDVDLVERDGSAYQLTIRVRDEQVGGRRLYQMAADYAGETMADVDSDYAALTMADLEADAAQAEAAALAAVPAGIVVTFEVAPDYTLSDLDDDFSADTLADVDAAAATLMDLTFYTP